MNVSFGNKQDYSLKKSSEPGITGKFFTGVASVNKFGIQVEEYTKGTAKGGIYGAAATTATAGFAWALTNIMEGNTKEVFTGIFTKPFGLIKDGVKNITALSKDSVLKATGKVLAWPYFFGKKILKSESIPKPAKYISLAAGFGALCATLVKARVNVNRRTADVDHRFKVGHRQ